MEIIVRPDDREYQAAKILEDFINDFGWDPKKFAKACCNMHRTLQQSLFRSIVEILICYAAEERQTDERNEASKEGAKKVLDVLNSLSIPFI